MSQIEVRIQNILKSNSLDNWSTDFCKSLLQQVQGGKSLSERQLEILSKKEVQFDGSWEAEWDSEKALKYELCISYYANVGAPYYGAMVGCARWKVEGYIIDWDKTPIPSKAVYEKLTLNKYGQKVLKNNKTPPKYGVGTMVKFRDTDLTRRGPHRLKMSYVTDKKVVARPFVVVANSGVQSRPGATRGSRKYCLLGAGDAIPIFVEERMLNLLKKKKKV